MSGNKANAPDFFIPPTYTPLRLKHTRKGTNGASPEMHITTNYLPAKVDSKSANGSVTSVGGRNSNSLKSLANSQKHSQPPGYEEYVTGRGPAKNIEASHLDLNLYDRTPLSNKKTAEIERFSESIAVKGNRDEKDLQSVPIIREAQEAREKKKRRFGHPRRNSKIDKLISLLEDKRIKDPDQLYQLQDLQMPRLRKVLNIIFVSLGVLFLLAVMVVIVYTTVHQDPLETPKENTDATKR